MIDLEQMSKEHEKLFPIADLRGQKRKFLEEAGEFAQADNTEKRIKELADCLIVCAGIYRFNPELAKSYALNVYKAGQALKIELNDIYTEVKRKWQINLGRTWEYKNGKYHHIGTDGNE